LQRQTDAASKGESGAESKIKAINEMHSEKTKALLKSINLLKKEIQKIKYNSKDNVRHQKNLRLEEDLKLMDLAINTLRKLVGDEDTCNSAIKKELEKGPARIRALGREELKIEVKKYKNISLKCIKEMQRLGGKVPGYATKLVKEAESGTHVEGLKTQKETPIHLEEDDNDADSMFEAHSDLGAEEISDKVQIKLDQQTDQITKLNLELRAKNEKILDMLNEVEEVKIQVYSRDKSIEL
jgi:hypothetical protein